MKYEVRKYISRRCIIYYFLFIERHVKPEEIGLEEPKGVIPEGKQPFVVAFFKNGAKLVNPDASARRKREARRWRNHGYSENYSRNPLTGNNRVLCVTGDSFTMLKII